jgi:CBS domain-containing protein
MKISEIMTSDCEWITPETTVTEAAKIMRDKDFGFLPVGDAAGEETRSAR